MARFSSGLSDGLNRFSPSTGVAGLHHRLEAPGVDSRPGDQRGDLPLLQDLPVDEFLDVRVVDVDDDHLGRAPRRAARLDGARRAVPHLEEAHQSRGLAAAGEVLVRRPHGGEVGPRARAVLEQARLADPQVHDAALVHQVVGDALDEAGVRLGMLVGGLRHAAFARPMIDVMVALGRTVDAVGPVQARVEPLRRVGGAHLAGQHVAHLVEQGPGVGVGVEVPALPAPVGPTCRPGGRRRSWRWFRRSPASSSGQRGERRFVGDLAPTERRDVVLLDRFQTRRDAGLAEVLLGDDVAGDLRPVLGDLEASRWKTTVPSGLRISLIASRNAMLA